MKETLVQYYEQRLGENLIRKGFCKLDDFLALMLQLSEDVKT